MQRDLWRLNRYRLRRDLTWPQLAAEMRAVDLAVSATTLYRILLSPMPRVGARTRHKVRQFVTDHLHKVLIAFAVEQYYEIYGYLPDVQSWFG